LDAQNSWASVVRANDIEAAKKLIATDPEIAEKQIAGEPPLTIAAISKKKEMVKLLLENGADVDAKSVGNYPVVHDLLRRRMGGTLGFRMVIETDPDLNVLGPGGQTPLVDC